jgi:hypothetical protein
MLRNQLFLDRFQYGILALILGTPSLIFLFIQFSAANSGNGWLIVGGLLGVLTAIAGGRFLLIAIWPEQHWIGRCLGQIDPNPWELARTIDAEWRAEGSLVEGAVPAVKAWWRPDTWFTVLTPNWLIHVSRGRIVVLIPDRISWVYLKVVAETRFFAKARFHHSVTCRMDANTAEFDVWARTELIAFWLASELIRRKPHALAGYQGEYIELGKDRPDMLLSQTEQRRGVYDALPHAEQALWIEDAIEDLDEFPRRIDPHAPETMK